MCVLEERSKEGADPLAGSVTSPGRYGQSRYTAATAALTATWIFATCVDIEHCLYETSLDNRHIDPISQPPADR